MVWCIKQNDSVQNTTRGGPHRDLLCGSPSGNHRRLADKQLRGARAGKHNPPTAFCGRANFVHPWSSSEKHVFPSRKDRYGENAKVSNRLLLKLACLASPMHGPNSSVAIESVSVHVESARKNKRSPSRVK